MGDQARQRTCQRRRAQAKEGALQNANVAISVERSACPQREVSSLKLGRLESRSNHHRKYSINPSSTTISYHSTLFPSQAKQIVHTPDGQNSGDTK